MMIIMSDTCAINVLRSINYKIYYNVNHTFRVVRMAPQLGASLTDDSRNVIYCIFGRFSFGVDIWKIVAAKLVNELGSLSLADT